MKICLLFGKQKAQGVELVWSSGNRRFRQRCLRLQLHGCVGLEPTWVDSCEHHTMFEVFWEKCQADRCRGHSTKLCSVAPLCLWVCLLYLSLGQKYELLFLAPSKHHSAIQ